MGGAKKTCPGLDVRIEESLKTKLTIVVVEKKLHNYRA
jgi:hypothetical protein